MLNCTDLACVLHHHHFYAHLHHLKRHLDGHHDHEVEEGEFQCILRAKSFSKCEKPDVDRWPGDCITRQHFGSMP